MRRGRSRLGSRSARPILPELLLAERFAEELLIHLDGVGFAGSDQVAACRINADLPFKAGARQPRRLYSTSGRPDILVLRPRLRRAVSPDGGAAGSHGRRLLLFDRVAVEGDDLHAVEQVAPGIVSETCSRWREDDLRKVDLDYPVVVPEVVVLGRVSTSKQGGRGVAAPVSADLVDLVGRITGFIVSASRGTDDPSRQGADVGCGGGRGSRLRRERPPARCTNSRPSALATDSPITEVLPVPGGPTRVRIAPSARLSALGSRSWRSFPHRDEFGDPPLHVIKAGVNRHRVPRGCRADRVFSSAVCSTGPRSTSRGRNGSSSPSPDCSP